MNRQRAIQEIIIPLVVAVIFPAAQNSQLLRIWGVNPNLAIVGLMILTIIIADYFRFFIFSGLLILFLKILPGFEIESAALLATALLMKIIKAISPWSVFLSPVLLIIMGTLVFYGIADYAFIFQEPGIFLRELAYNIVLGALAYLGLSAIYEEAR